MAHSPGHGAAIPGSTATLQAVQQNRQAQPAASLVYLGLTDLSLAGHPTQGWRGVPRGPLVSPDAAQSNLGRAQAVTGRIRGPDTADPAALMSAFEAMSFKKKKELAKRLAMAGYLGGTGSLQEIVDNATLGDITNAYGDLLNNAAARYSNGQKVTPDDILDMNIKFNLNQIGADENSKPGSWWGAMTGKADETLDQSGTTVRKDTSVDIYSAADARGLARGTLQNALGRDPTEAEYEDFVGALQTKQRENPQTTTTRMTTNEEGAVTNTSSSTTGGMGESAVQQFAYEQARENPGYAEWQAIGTYLPMALSALGAGVAGT